MTEQPVVPAVELCNISMGFASRGVGVRGVLSGVSLCVAEGEFVCIVGGSGTGKTTLLRIVAGLEASSEGRVLIGGRLATTPGPDRGFVFQQYALFPWRTVRDNVEFGLEMKGMRKKDRHAIAEEYLRLVGLEGYGRAWPRELSGGMRQRCAIARAYAVEPRVLLMDEPFGSVDAMTRGGLQRDLQATWMLRRSTVLFVTHDVEEAVYLGQRVVVLGGVPAEIIRIIEVGLVYPRTDEMRTTEEFLSYKRDILDAVHRASGG